jgi:GR25 family glycosyltransferase involved in LPS biosynthesis
MIWLFFLFFSSLFGGVDAHFKKAEGKEEGRSIRNIDFIYMINLDERPEKFEMCLEQLILYGIHPYRFSAVNGWQLTLDDINDVGVKFAPEMAGGFYATRFRLKENGERYFSETQECSNPECPCNGPYVRHHEPIGHYGFTYFCHCPSPGMIGIALSHLSILQDAYDSGYETIWVMEDDIELIKDPRLLSVMIDKLDALVGHSGWDILFTDRDTKNNDGVYVPCWSFAQRPNFTPPNPYKFERKQEISPDFRSIGARYGAYSMIIRRSGMEKLLRFFKEYQIYLPFDMDYTLPPGIRLFTVLDDIVSTRPKSPSDNGIPYYLNAHRNHS